MIGTETKHSYLGYIKYSDSPWTIYIKKDGSVLLTTKNARYREHISSDLIDLRRGKIGKWPR